MNNQQIHREEMDNCVYNWLASHLSTGNDHRSVDWVKETLRQQRVTTFLLVWPIMERDCFERDLNGNSVRDFSQNYANLYSKINNDDTIDYMLKHFHKRFGGLNNQRRDLLAGDRPIPENVRCFFTSNNSLPQSDDKLKLHAMLYITERYRNNIFHGNKLFESWTNVSNELDYCITFMMRLVDAYRTRNG